MKIFGASWNMKDKTFKFIFSLSGITQIDEDATKKFVDAFTSKNVAVSGINSLIYETNNTNSVRYIKLAFDNREKVVNFFTNTEVQDILKTCGFSARDINTAIDNIRNSFSTSPNAANARMLGTFARSNSVPLTNSTNTTDNSASASQPTSGTDYRGCP
jgi:hypothetical protein